VYNCGVSTSEYIYVARSSRSPNPLDFFFGTGKVQKDLEFYSAVGVLQRDLEK
jgi:hypothetical protein